MNKAPKWFVPVAVVALLWNLLGCAAYLSDVMLTPEDIAKMSPAQQEMYASRPAWGVGATAIAVWCGALGCVGLILRKRWSLVFLLLSLAGVIVQDIGVFVISDAGRQAAGLVGFILQGVVLIVALALVLLSRTGIQRQWLG